MKMHSQTLPAHRETEDPPTMKADHMAQKPLDPAAATAPKGGRHNKEDDGSASHMSSISGSMDGGSSMGDENSEDIERFERSLRQKHTKACKAMAVSTKHKCCPLPCHLKRRAYSSHSCFQTLVLHTQWNYQNGVYDTALQEFETILSDLLGKYGEKHERVGAALHNVAIANLRAGSLDDAMDAIEEAIKIRSRSLGRSHPKVADSLVELGIILLSMEEHADSIKVFERALKLRRNEHEDMYSQEDMDDSNLKIAKVLNNMGCVNFEQNNLQEAQKNFDEAIKLQKGVFRSLLNFSVGYDTSSPGILTMASTMCNMGYVAIEQGEFSEAIKIFKTSLQIQQAVLGPGNKLVQSSLDNLGYSHTMMNQYDKAALVYQEIWDTQKLSSDTTEEKIETLKKIVICFCRIEKYERAFKYLELLDDAQTDVEADSPEVYQIRKLMGEVNYQILKLPSLSDQTNKVVGFALCMGETEQPVDLENWVIGKPENTSKMSGHRVTHA